MDSDFLAKFEEILDRKFDEYAKRTTKYLDEKFDEYAEITTKRLDEKFEENRRYLDEKFDEYAERTTKRLDEKFEENRRYLDEKFNEQHSRGVTSLSMHLYDMTSSLGNQINDILKETQDIKENNKVIFARFEYDESRISKLERILNVG